MFNKAININYLKYLRIIILNKYLVYPYKHLVILGFTTYLLIFFKNVDKSILIMLTIINVTKH